MVECGIGGCEYEAQNGFIYCGKHLNHGQDNNDGETMCCIHPDRYAERGLIICGECNGYGPSCAK